MEIKEKVMGGLFWRFSERFLAQVISFVVSMVLARLLSPGEYGMVSVVMIFITIANVLVINDLEHLWFKRRKLMIWIFPQLRLQDWDCH